MENIINAVDQNLIEREIRDLENYKLLVTGDFEAYFAPSSLMPNVMVEISRLREITFREIGEGTGLCADTDKYDSYYHHLFIWNSKDRDIVGAYRIGFGREIMNKYGINGFYITSLFDLRESVWHMLYNTLELGRSFVISKYQRRATPLFILWKSILLVLITNKADYLIGPVSLSGVFSENTKALVTAFLKRFYYDNMVGMFVINREKQTVKVDDNIDIEAFLAETNGDFSKLDKFVRQYEPNYTTPVLIRQYLTLLNAKAIGFNVDPLFSNCLDSLVLLRFNDVPKDFLGSLSKDI